MSAILKNPSFRNSISTFMSRVKARRLDFNLNTTCVIADVTRSKT